MSYALSQLSFQCDTVANKAEVDSGTSSDEYFDSTISASDGASM